MTTTCEIRWTRWDFCFVLFSPPRLLRWLFHFTRNFQFLRVQDALACSLRRSLSFCDSTAAVDVAAFTFPRTMNGLVCIRRVTFRDHMSRVLRGFSDIFERDWPRSGLDGYLFMTANYYTQYSTIVHRALNEVVGIVNVCILLLFIFSGWLYGRRRRRSSTATYMGCGIGLWIPPSGLSLLQDTIILCRYVVDRQSTAATNELSINVYLVLGSWCCCCCYSATTIRYHYRSSPLFGCCAQPLFLLFLCTPSSVLLVHLLQYRIAAVDVVYDLNFVIFTLCVCIFQFGFVVLANERTWTQESVNLSITHPRATAQHSLYFTI